MVSVPATAAVENTTNYGGGGGGGSELGVKRIQVKRDVGGDPVVETRTVASPKGSSPAKLRAANENHNAGKRLHAIRSSKIINFTSHTLVLKIYQFFFFSFSLFFLQLILFSTNGGEEIGEEE